MTAMILAAMVAISIPDDFDPDLNLRYKQREDGRLHMSRESAGFAVRLVAQGEPEGIALAVKILDAVLELEDHFEAEQVL